MLVKKSGTTVSAAAPKHQYQMQFYNQPEHLSRILAPLKTKFQLKQLKGLLAEILFALQRPTVSEYDKVTLLLYFDKLLRLYVSNRRGLKR